MRKYILSILIGAVLLGGCGVVNTPPAPPANPCEAAHSCDADEYNAPWVTTTTTFEVVCQAIDCTEEVK